MVARATYDQVHAIVTRAFSIDQFVFGPDTDLWSIADQIGDYECLEGALETIAREFDVVFPSGFVRQICMPKGTTITHLAEIAERRVWPQAWAQ